MKPKTLPVHEDILFFAFRYALGRRTGAVGFVVEELKKHWPKLKPEIQRQIQKEITDAIDRRDAGDQCDEERWQEVLALNAKSEDMNLPKVLYRSSDAEPFYLNKDGTYSMAPFTGANGVKSTPHRHGYHRLLLAGFTKTKPIVKTLFDV